MCDFFGVVIAKALYKNSCSAAPSCAGSFFPASRLQGGEKKSPKDGGQT